MRRFIAPVFLVAAIPTLASCEQQGIAAMPFQGCSTVHVQFARSRFEVRGSASPKAVAEAANAFHRERKSEQLYNLGGDAYVNGRWTVVAVEGCGK